MKMIIKYIPKVVLCFFVLFMAQACVNLEEDTSSILTIDNLKDEGAIASGLAPIYRQYQEILQNPQMELISAFGSDDMTTWWAGNKAPLRVFDQFTYGNGENSAILWLDYAWNGYWKLIYFSNSLINGLKTSTANAEIIKTADANARFFRALAYFALVKRYGNMPIIIDGMIPTGEETRATVLENYNQIETDLKIAEANLPDPGQVANKGTVSNAAAKALLADFYLTWAGWPLKDATKYALAAQKAKDVINMNYFQLLPIDQLYLAQNGNSKESIFSIQFSKTENLLNQYPNHFAFHQAGGWSDIYPEKQFFNDFPAGPRKDATFYTNIPLYKSVNGLLVPNTPSTVAWQSSERLHPMYKKFVVSADLSVAFAGKLAGFRPLEIYRYAEVLLIYAEASARINGGSASGDALEALNQVKRRAMGLPYNLSNATVDVTSATADQIIAEKGWELAGEHGKRWWDLVRTETVAQIAGHRDPTEQSPLVISPAAITWKQYIAPIPYLAILSSKLTQNPEGFKIK